MVVDANPDLSIIPRNENDVGHLIRMLLFPDETRVYKLFDFWFDCFHDFKTELSLLLFDWFGVRVDVEMMHNNLGVEPRHIFIISSEDIYILSYKLY